MGYFLNNEEPYVTFKEAVRQPYFIDKSDILKDIFPLIDSTEKYICITRPRRFGKTIMANLIGSFFPKPIILQIFLILLKLQGILHTTSTKTSIILFI